MEQFNRRNFLTAGFASSLAFTLPNASKAWGVNDTRSLKLYNVHNKESVHTVYWRNGYYDKDGIEKLVHFFRDWRNGKMHYIDYGLYDILYTLQAELGIEDTGFKLISGYRSPETNAMLRRRSNGVAKTSLHMRGLAADIRPINVSLNTLRKKAVRLKEGGVGYYPSSNFIHVDTGRFRTW
jgi:uncharacterized protein YcbK (DUF882 family)